MRVCSLHLCELQLSDPNCQHQMFCRKGKEDNRQGSKHKEEQEGHQHNKHRSIEEEDGSRPRRHRGEEDGTRGKHRHHDRDDRGHKESSERHRSRDHIGSSAEEVGRPGKHRHGSTSPKSAEPSEEDQGARNGHAAIDNSRYDICHSAAFCCLRQHTCRRLNTYSLHCWYAQGIHFVYA